MAWLLRCPALYHAVCGYIGCDGIGVLYQRISGDYFSGFIIYRVYYFSDAVKPVLPEGNFFSVYYWFYRICKRRLNGQSGAIVGLLYGLIALVYFLIWFSILRGLLFPRTSPFVMGVRTGF
jgi:hypothetical protein